MDSINYIKNSGLYSIDTHKQYLSVNKIHSVDHKLALENIILISWVTKARIVSSRSYSYHDVNCNYMQDAS
jgi:hypothetical protein